MRQPHDPGNVVGGLGKNHCPGTALVLPTVIFVEHELFRTVEHGIFTDDFAEFADDGGVHESPFGTIVILSAALGFWLLVLGMGPVDRESSGGALAGVFLKDRT